MQISDANNLTTTLIQSTEKYISSRIAASRSRKVYNQVVKDCLEFYQDADVSTYIQVLKNYRAFISVDKKYKNTILGDNKRFAFMAVDHCIDAADSVRRRFVDGGCSDVEQFINSIGEL